MIRFRDDGRWGFAVTRPAGVEIDTGSMNGRREGLAMFFPGLGQSTEPVRALGFGCPVRALQQAM